MKVHPGYLNLISRTKCFFCSKTTKELNYELTSKLLSYGYGYIHCNKCMDIAEQETINWIKLHKKISWLYLIIILNININMEEDMFLLQRTNGKIENDWFLNINGWIEKNEKTDEYFLPMVKYINNKMLFKNSVLKNFCKLNHQFDYIYLKKNIDKWI